MIDVWIAVAVVVAVVVWLVVDSVRQSDRAACLATRLLALERRVEILTDRVVRGGDG